MTYCLEAVTLRTNNSPEGMRKIDALWQDVTSGKLPILFDSAGSFRPGVSPISQYSNYASDEQGDYDLSIRGVMSGFFQELEQAVSAGAYKKYDLAGENLSECTRRAWNIVWQEQRDGLIDRAFSIDYESAVPAEYTKDGKAHCYLYIAVK